MDRTSIAAVVLALAACSGARHSDPVDSGWTGSSDGGACASLERQMAEALDSAAADTSISTEPACTLLLEAEDGRRFTYSRAGSTPDTRYESASTSKWVAATVIMDLVDQGILSLDSTPHDVLSSFWTGESSVTLRDLLSFTSGFSEEPLCITGKNLLGTFQSCVETIYSDNLAKGVAPAGSEFYYAGSHLQIAGQMAVTAKGAPGWTEIFDAFKARTGLFPTSSFNLPALDKPRLAGGMTWTGAEYLGFLRALYFGQVLIPASRTALLGNQRGAATVGFSPTLGGGPTNTVGIGEDWAYGFGNWLECPSAKQPGSFNCGAGHRNSSPGAYGAYPFIDFDNRYFGILARQGKLGTYPEGIRLFRSVESLAARWAKQDCGS